jgi:hypothetical protein
MELGEGFRKLDFSCELVGIIACQSSAIINTVGSLREGNLVFTVKVVELDS